MAKVKALQPISFRGKPVKVGEVIEVEDEAEALDMQTHAWVEVVDDETELTAAAGDTTGQGADETHPPE